MRFVRVGAAGFFFFWAGQKIRSADVKWPTYYSHSVFAAANEICAHYILLAGGCYSGGHVNIKEVEPPTAPPPDAATPPPGCWAHFFVFWGHLDLEAF